ncbi:Cytochrome c oxidase assembly protein cox11, mitochondrial [Lithohypha guttulata]|nr:Cytochrome c oxidase assembly protein cox11, mitochondrial [Lithohypha guttulata]
MRRSTTWHSIARSLRQSSSKPTPTPTSQPPPRTHSLRAQQRFFSSAHHVRQQHYRNSPYQAARSAAKEKNRTTMYYGASLIIGTVALSYGSVPLYKMICQQTGWSGQPVKAHENTSSDLPASERLKPMADHRRLRITFNGSVSDVLPWKFTPQQREVRVLPGETALAFYTATNKSEADIIGVATYSVTPGQVAPYFSKIQCFCFEEQKLNKGETVDMPVFFFIDPDFAKDPNMRGIDTITLSYTFFKARYDKNGVLTTIPGALMPA